MGKHSAPYSAEEIGTAAIEAEATAIALREFADSCRALGRGAFNCGEFTAATYQEETAETADRLAKRFEISAAELWAERRAAYGAGELSA